MTYSIVMPVYNRADLTRDCLQTLPPTLAGAGEGELIVVDNGSQPETAHVLAQFPWVRVIRNEVNLGFAVACNQGAAAANGRYVCFLNNDMIAHAGWLAKMMARCQPDIGIVGARLFFADGTIQHAGVATLPMRFGIEGVLPHHLYWGAPGNLPAAAEFAELDIVTGACLLTPRDLFAELGGFDQTYWNGYEDVDYCLRVRERGLRVVYEADATLLHLESQSGVQRKRRLSYNVHTLSARWGSRVEPDHNLYLLRGAYLRRESFPANGRGFTTVALPPVTVVVHGPAPVDPDAFRSSLASNRTCIESVVWLATGTLPDVARPAPGNADDLAAARALLQGRSDRYFAFVHTQTVLAPGWLDELINAIEYGHEVVAATATPHSADLEPCAADGRCTLLNLRNVPSHIRIGPVETIDAALVDLTWQAVVAGASVRAVRRGCFGELPAPVDDPAFAARYGLPHDVLRRADAGRLEAACADRAAGPTFASIVMLSWNAPAYTRTAVESIRAHTASAYEIIIIDNGSGAETRAMLAGLEDVRVIYNSENKGFAYGCNQGLAAAAGTHVVLLNNDVVVTAGWLENLLAAHARDPLVGVSAPRSNRVVGHQQIGNLNYASLDEMHAFAAERTREFAGTHYRTDRAIGFCLCIARNVIDEVGGIDTRYGVGNFEDDDYCIRVRAAGYQIVVCQDAFIHHFGSVSFTTNKIDYTSQMEKNWQIFAARWNLPKAYPVEGYNAAPAIAAGFRRERDYVALPQPFAPSAKVEPALPPRAYATAFVALVDGDAAWSRIGPIVTNYIRALSADDPSLFAIGVTGAADATIIGARIARSIGKLHMEERHVADIDVADIEDSGVGEWLTAIPASACLSIVKDDRLAGLTFAADRSPSGLARAVRGERR